MALPANLRTPMGTAIAFKDGGDGLLIAEVDAEESYGDMDRDEVRGFIEDFRDTTAREFTRCELRWPNGAPETCEF